MHVIDSKVSISRGYLLLILSVVFILFSILHWPNVNVVVWLTFFVIVYSLPFMALFPKIMAVLMFGTGHLIYFQQGLSFSSWQTGLLENLPLVALFVAVPLFSYPLKNGGYVDYVYKLSHRFLKRPITLFSNILLSTTMLSSFMNLGSVRISYDLFSEDIQQRQKFFTKALAQGFSISMCWSPYFAGVAIIVNMLELSLFPFIFWGLLLVIGGTAVSLGLIYKEARQIELKEADYPSVPELPAQESIKMKKGAELAFVFGLMFLLLFIADLFFEINLVVMISIVGFLFPLLWSLMIRESRSFFGSMKHYRHTVLPNLHNEAVLFIAAAFFAEMVKRTAIADAMQMMFVYFNRASSFFIILLIIFLIAFLAFLGIHQILTVSLIGASVPLSSMAVNAETLGLAMIAGWSVATIISPVTALNLTLGNILNKSPIQVGLWSWEYVVVVIPFMSFIIYAISFVQ
ncbi:hypothetical protein [Alteribacillus sp. HJP-4]|uniref:hypothetical protein n=1 Tax=Alteribacillus sp. HJP-4 TaxID=2775394 RepID=UPI0035CCFB12